MEEPKWALAFPHGGMGRVIWRAHQSSALALTSRFIPQDERASTITITILAEQTRLFLGIQGRGMIECYDIATYKSERGFQEKSPGNGL